MNKLLTYNKSCLINPNNAEKALQEIKKRIEEKKEGEIFFSVAHIELQDNVLVLKIAHHYYFSLVAINFPTHEIALEKVTTYLNGHFPRGEKQEG